MKHSKSRTPVRPRASGLLQVPRPVWWTGVVAAFAAAVMALGTCYTPAPASPEADSVRADSILEEAAETQDVELGSTVARPAAGVTEVPSSRVGALAMEQLRGIDQIAYIRFASVYQSFEDLEDLKREVDTLYAEKGDGALAK